MGARAKYPDSSLADLYDELTMPPELLKAHKENGKPFSKPTTAFYEKNGFVANSSKKRWSCIRLIKTVSMRRDIF